MITALQDLHAIERRLALHDSPMYGHVSFNSLCECRICFHLDTLTFHKPALQSRLRLPRQQVGCPHCTIHILREPRLLPCRRQHGEILNAQEPTKTTSLSSVPASSTCQSIRRNHKSYLTEDPTELSSYQPTRTSASANPPPKKNSMSATATKPVQPITTASFPAWISRLFPTNYQRLTLHSPHVPQATMRLVWAGLWGRGAFNGDPGAKTCILYIAVIGRING